jgi:hypothetical protein
MIKYMLAGLVLIGCGGQSYENELQEIGEESQELIARANYGWHTSGLRCPPDTGGTCFYPPNRNVTVRLELNGYPQPVMVDLAEDAMDSVLSSFNANLNQFGYTFTRLFGVPAQAATVVIRSNFSEVSPVGMPCSTITDLISATCDNQSAPLTEMSLIPGTHRTCHRVLGQINQQRLQWNSFNQGDINNGIDQGKVYHYYRHAFGSMLNKGCGLGVTTGGGQTTFSAQNLSPQQKSGFQSTETCLLNSAGFQDPNTYTRRTTTCP